MKKTNAPLFTAAMREHSEIVERAWRKATAIYAVCHLCSATVLATAIIVACSL